MPQTPPSPPDNTTLSTETWGSFTNIIIKENMDIPKRIKYSTLQNFCMVIEIDFMYVNILLIIECRIVLCISLMYELC